MTEHTQHTELIDSYLSGSMTTSEETSFMDLIETDPILKEEFLFQQSIVGGLREYRKNELKNRLSSISIGVGFFGFLMNASYYKVMAAALTLGIIGYGTYYTITAYFGENDLPDELVISETSHFDLLIVDHPKNNSNQFINPDVMKGVYLLADDFRPSLKSDIKVSKTIPDKKQQKTILIKDPTIAEKSNETSESSKESKIAIPEFSVPKFNEEPLEEEALSGLAIDINNLESLGISNSEEDKEIEIEQFKKNNKVLQYKFTEGKLYLYGDFRGDPYELLEINTKGQKRLYFYHHKQYFRLDRYQKSISDFIQITDKKLMKELEILRTSK